MPLEAALLLRADVLAIRLTEQIFRRTRADGADLLVCLTTVVAIGREDGVDVEAGRFWLARELTQTGDKLLLELVGEVILLAEEDDATLGDFASIS